MSIKHAKKTHTTEAAPALFVGQSQTLQHDQAQGPDFVTALFDLLEQTHPDITGKREAMEDDVRHYMRGQRGTVLAKPDKNTRARKVLALFNGRNAREVARKLGISRTSVYRYLKQPGGQE